MAAHKCKHMKNCKLVTGMLLAAAAFVVAGCAKTISTHEQPGIKEDLNYRVPPAYDISVGSTGAVLLTIPVEPEVAGTKNTKVNTIHGSITGVEQGVEYQWDGEMPAKIDVGGRPACEDFTRGGRQDAPTHDPERRRHDQRAEYLYAECDSRVAADDPFGSKTPYRYGLCG